MDHHYWTLITYAWVHAVSLFGDPSLFWVHIGMNMFALWCLGPVLEDYLGHWRYLGLYFGGAIAAALFWWLVRANGGASQGIVGASGAIFALVAGAGTAAPREVFDLGFLKLPHISLSLWAISVAIIGLEVVQVIMASIPFIVRQPLFSGWLTQIAHTAHLGGALYGFLYVMLLRYLASRRTVHH